MNVPAWLTLLTTVAPAPTPPPPVNDCNAPAYGALTYSRPPTNAKYCSTTVITSTEKDSNNLPVVPSGLGAWMTQVDTFSEVFNIGQDCLTTCVTPVPQVATGGATHIVTMTKSRTQTQSATLGLIDAVFNYLRGVQWAPTLVSSTTCSTTDVIQIPIVTIGPGSRRVAGWVWHNQDYNERRTYQPTNSTSVTTVTRNESFQTVGYYDSGIGNVSATYDRCTNSWSGGTMCSAVPCTATGGMEF